MKDLDYSQINVKKSNHFCALIKKKIKEKLINSRGYFKNYIEN